MPASTTWKLPKPTASSTGNSAPHARLTIQGSATWVCDRSREPNAATSGLLVLDPLQKIPVLAVEYSAHCLERAEPYCLRAPIFQHRDIGRADADSLGELAYAHLALG